MCLCLFVRNIGTSSFGGRACPILPRSPSQMFSYFSISAEGATFLWVEANRLQAESAAQVERESGKRASKGLSRILKRLPPDILLDTIRKTTSSREMPQANCLPITGSRAPFVGPLTEERWGLFKRENKGSSWLIVDWAHGSVLWELIAAFFVFHSSFISFWWNTLQASSHIQAMRPSYIRVHQHFPRLI